ncbi:MAG TPA: OsmC family protein [Bryobacteraceae bacterium]|nr:OsmC family protein [Bryobacteraceae bacterium]
MRARHHRAFTDQPFDDDGTDTAMTPTELFLSSLGACAAYYAEEYVRARGLPDEDLEIRIASENGGRPTRIASLRLDVIAPGLNQRHRDGILRAVDACLLKNTLIEPPHIEIRVVSSPGQAMAVEPEIVLAH